MNTKDNISVIVPVFNAEVYLRRCIESILCSQFKKFELLLVNDGSVDQSRSICKWYEKKDRRVRLIEQEHLGVSAARNRGICESSGEWIVFVDSDDFITDDFFSLIMRKEYEAQDLLIFDFAGSDEWRRYLRRRQSSQKAIMERQYNEKDNLLLVDKMLRCHQLMKGGHTDLRSVGAKAYKRKIIQQYFLEFPAELIMGEDQIFQIGYQMKVKRCIYLKKAVYFIETHPDSATQRYQADTWKHYLYFLRHLKDVLKSYPCYPVWKEGYYDAVLSNLKGILVMGIFHPQNSDSTSKKYKLCRKIRGLQMVERAVKYSNRQTGDWTRKVLLFFFRFRCYPVVGLICRIGHIRMKWKKR